LETADLNFFDTKLILPTVVPKTAADVLRVTEQVRSGNATAPAASLWPYYKEKKKLDLIIIVTDEVENRPVHGYRFAELLVSE